MGTKLCLGQENNQQSVFFDSGCCLGRLREHKEGKRKYVESKYQEGKKMEREHAERSPAEYRD